jgi:hypothetical protein
LGFSLRAKSVKLSVLFVDENRDGLLPDELVLDGFEHRGLQMGIEVYWHDEIPLNAWNSNLGQRRLRVPAIHS